MPAKNALFSCEREVYPSHCSLFSKCCYLGLCYESIMSSRVPILVVAMPTFKKPNIANIFAKRECQTKRLQIAKKNSDFRFQIVILELKTMPSKLFLLLILVPGAFCQRPWGRVWLILETITNNGIFDARVLHNSYDVKCLIFALCKER